MSIDKIKQKLIQNSIKDSGWLQKAKWRQENEDWLDISFSIAIRVASTLSANKKENIYPKNQVELAEAMDCSPQYINKLLRGQEKLQIDTICKVSRILKIKLIEVPKTVITKTIQYQPTDTWLGTLNIKSPATTTSSSYSKLKIVENYELAA
ncbi:helix-turn-helix domain-containing protein [Flavobacterium sp. ZS1P14]|uniref:helix-turn-helix domain-containing protein n=1 Tax=Flavobacterium sp. ZS1P14 TaxID=3401729 RepID=UPI003AAEA07C